MTRPAPTAPPPGSLVLQAASLRVVDRVILHPLTLTLEERRIAVIGRNGSGKTTLLRLLAGLIAPSDGTVRVAGIDPAKDRRGALAELGILFQNPDHQIIFPTVIEELAFGLRQLGQADAEDRALALLRAWDRAHWAKASVSTLSQGQRQFLCLLAVLAMAPATILLDEPFSGLDLPLRAQLARRLAALPQRVIVITHDPALIADHDRILWLDEGRLRAEGPPSTVLPQYLAEMERLGGLDADADLAD